MTPDIQTGGERVRLVSNILMIILLIGNVFFSYQYIQNIQKQDAQTVADQEKFAQRVQIAHFMKYFIDTVLNTKGTISFDDRVKLENDIRQTHDTALIDLWTAFVNSKDNKTAQDNVVKLMSALSGRMI